MIILELNKNEQLRYIVTFQNLIKMGQAVRVYFY